MEISMVMKDLGVLVGVPVLRSVAGWAEKALEDNVITRFEWNELIKTVIRVGSLGFIGFLGFSSVGMENAAVIGAVSGFIADKLLRLKK